MHLRPTMSRNVMGDTGLFVLCWPAALNPSEHWAELLMGVKVDWAGHPFSTPITVIITHEQWLTSRKLGHFLVAPIHLAQYEAQYGAEGKLPLLWIIKAFSTWCFWRSSSSVQVVLWTAIVSSNWSVALLKNHQVHLEFSFIQFVTGCFALQSSVKCPGKPPWRYKVNMCRVTSPGTGPTLRTGARLLLFRSTLVSPWRPR